MRVKSWEMARRRPPGRALPGPAPFRAAADTEVNGPSCPRHGTRHFVCTGGRQRKRPPFARSTPDDPLQSPGHRRRRLTFVTEQTRRRARRVRLTRTRKRPASVRRAAVGPSPIPAASAFPVETPEEPSILCEPLDQGHLKRLHRRFIRKIVFLARRAWPRDDHRVTVWAFNPNALPILDEQPRRQRHSRAV